LIAGPVAATIVIVGTTAEAVDLHRGTELDVCNLRGESASELRPDILYDLTGDGRGDLVRTTWRGKPVILVSEGGHFPWPEKGETRDWDAFLSEAFDAGEGTPQTWNEKRADWGSYTIMIDMDADGVFDGPGDFCYRALDVDGDGRPEAEFIVLAAGSEGRLRICKLFVCLNGSHVMNHIDWEQFAYADEQLYTGASHYIQGVHGNGLFLNGRVGRPWTDDIRMSWENPIALYDFDDDGFTDMVIRAADAPVPWHKWRNPDRPLDGRLEEFEVAFDIDRSSGPEAPCHLDMQITFTAYKKGGLPYMNFEQDLPFLHGLSEADALFPTTPAIRKETRRCFLPYFDGYKIGTDYDGWEAVWFLFDEDNDDNRWEEMFSPYEDDWHVFADHIGDRVEHDRSNRGGGRLYVGPFDGKIHLYGADDGEWRIDYYGLYKGSVDRKNTDEGPMPPEGLLYPLIRYSDNDGDGLFDRIDYLVAWYGCEEDTLKVERTVSLTELAGGVPFPGGLPTVEIRVDEPLTGQTLADWDGSPIRNIRTAGRTAYDRLADFFRRTTEKSWQEALALYDVTRQRGWNRSENEPEFSTLPDCEWLDPARPRLTKAQLAELKEIVVLSGYSSLTTAETLMQKYRNAFWLKEKVFADVLKCAPPRAQRELERLYYFGRFDRLIDRINRL